MNTLRRRTFLRNSLLATSAVTLGQRLSAAPGETINAALIGLGWRGGELMKQALGVPGLQITWLVDPDSTLIAKAKQEIPKARTSQDLRHALEDKDVDVVIIATCNHWHCLAAIWACQAGKDVYVEKPLGHNLIEQRRLIEVATKTGRIVQVGTQQRSDTVQDEIRSYLHQEKALGEILYIHANRYGLREPVPVLRGAPLEIPKEVDYDLWCGPAKKEQLQRPGLHYDWHWRWNTGNGEMGNWGVHIMDDVRNVGLADQVGLPKRILAGGGRLVWKDAGQTPNVHFAYYDTGSIPVLFDLCNLPLKPGSKASPGYMNIRDGYTVHCEGGRYSGGRGGGAAYDKDGKRIRKFSGNAGKGHMENFIEAVRTRNAGILHAPLLQGHYSSAWCELANIGYKTGAAYSRDAALEINKGLKGWSDLLDTANERLLAHGISLEDPACKLSPVLEIDAATERFTGELAGQANAHLGREYRAGYELPEA